MGGWGVPGSKALRKRAYPWGGGGVRTPSETVTVVGASIRCIDSKQNSTSPHDLTKGAKTGGIGQKCSFRFPEKANRTAMLLLGITITAFAGGRGGAAQPQNRYANQHTPGGGRGSTPPRYERNENQADYNHFWCSQGRARRAPGPRGRAGHPWP